MSLDEQQPRVSINLGRDLFRRYTMRELLREPTTFEWLVRGLLVQPTYGQLAGPMKALKSVVLDNVAVGVAAGVPIFGHFDPGLARPVLAYIGEGGRIPWTRRIRRICAAYDVDPGDIDLYPCFDVAPITSNVFQESLRRDLDEVHPALVTLDPLYAFHGTTTRASDLHQEGALLNQLSRPCMDVGASLLAANHFNQTGAGRDLRRITMAGSGEWADSWVLLEHREQPDVAAGLFHLSMDVGSRQWGGSQWELDIDLGHFDEDACAHDGTITWDLRRASHTPTPTATRTDPKARARQRILDVLADCPWQYTKRNLRDVVGGRHNIFDEALGELVGEGHIEQDERRRSESGVERTRPLWGLRATRPLDEGTGCAGDVS